MDDIVVSTLCKRTIDIAERNQTIFCHTCRECHSMTFGNTYVEGSVCHFCHHYVHRTSCRHGRCNANNLLVLLSHLEQGVSEYILISWWLRCAIVDDTLTSLRVEFARSMPYCCTLFSRFIPLALSGVQV